MRNLLAASRDTIHQQLYFVQIGIHPDRNLGAFLAVPVPMRKQMQRRLRAPPGFVVVKVVLGEPAQVDNAEVGTDRWPTKWCRFAAVIEARPREPTCRPIPLTIKLPP